MTAELKVIPLKQIRENPDALRTVDRTNEKYLQLVESVKEKGVLNPIGVRLLNEESNGQPLYSVVDGLHRFSAAVDAGLTEIPTQVLSLNQVETMEAQLVANLIKIETKPAQYSKSLRRILALNPTLTKMQLAKNLSQSPKWLDDRLSLSELTTQAQTLVDEGKIGLSNAYLLAKLPQAEQTNFLERAMTEPPQQFTPAIQNRIKEIRDAKRQGKTPGPTEFQPHPFLRKVTELKQEMESGSIGPALLKQNGITTPDAAFNFALQWALNMDPASKELQKQNEEKRKADETKRKEERKKERLEQQAKEAAERVAQLQKT